MVTARLAPRALTLLVCALAVSAPTARAQSLVATKGAEAPPPELNAAISAALAPGSVTVKSGDIQIDLWWVKALALTKSSDAPGWADVADGTLAGAIRVSAPWSDIRGYVVRPGVYTLRYVKQPANGDHLGVSPNREFLLMSPAAVDATPDPVGYKGAVDLSKQTVRRAHPSALSIDPPTATAAPLSPVKTDLGLEGFVFSVPTSAGSPINFGLILSGVIQN